jgi:hypothetical protein
LANNQATGFAAMDNILKYVLGVLGVFALVLVAMPSGEMPKSKTVASSAAIKPIAPQAIKPIPPSDNSSGDSDFGDDGSFDDSAEPDELTSFGQPMNNATPLGGGDGYSNNESGRQPVGGSNAPLPPGAIPATPNAPGPLPDGGNQQ